MCLMLKLYKNITFNILNKTKIFIRMNKLILLFACLFTTNLRLSSQIQVLESNEKTKPIAFIETGKSFFLVSDKVLFEYNVKTKKWDTNKIFTELNNTAVLLKDNIWMGNNINLFYRDKNNNFNIWNGLKKDKMAVLSLKINPTTQELLVSTADDGAYVLKDTVLGKTVVAHIRAEDFCHCGDFDWIATNTGLVRVDKTDKIQIYAEEGVGGFEIPDNSVDRLYCPNGKLLWVVMQGALAFLDAEAKSVTSHAEGFDFLGKKGNTIYDELATPTGNFLFLTRDGLILMSQKEVVEPHEHTASTEVYSNVGKPKISKIVLETPIKDTWQKGYFDKKGNLWLASNNNVFKVSKNDLKKWLK